MTRTRWSLYIAMSLHGRIADGQGGVDWLTPGDGEDYGLEAFLAGIDSIVMGRRTFDRVLGFGQWPYAGKRVVVLTHRPPPPTVPEGVTFRAGAVATIAAELQADAQGVWLVGGADVAARCLAAGLLHRPELFVMPLLLGAGPRLFPDGRQAGPFAPTGQRRCANGVGRLTDRLRGPGPWAAERKKPRRRSHRRRGFPVRSAAGWGGPRRRWNYR